jgi:hypothetical protein
MMTLTQAERLVRRISELLGLPAMEAQAAKLAQDYSELARAGSRRLEQCALMIEAGEDLQALQLAETPPPLLDLITILSFRQASEWRSYCQAHNLPWVEPFYDKYVRALNSTYGKGIASDHPFYRDYRRAVISNDDERALSILRVIARLNPADQNTAQELQRLQDKVLRSKLEGLQQALASRNTAAVLAELTQLESTTLPIPPAHPVWQQAQLLRCQDLLSQAQALRDRDDWQETELVVEEIQALANHHGVVLSPEDTGTWNALEAWAAAKRTALVEAQDIQHALEALDYQVQTCEAKRGQGLSQTLPEWQGDFNSLANKWQEAERLGCPLDEALLARCQESSEWLQNRIHARLKRKRFLAFLGLMVGLAAGAAAGFLGWEFFQEKQFLTQVTTLERTRRVVQTDELLARLPARFKTRPRLAASIAEARQFVARETGFKGRFDQKLATLQTLAAHGFTNGLTQVEPVRAECLQALDSLAPEFQPGGKSNLAAFDEHWQGHLRGLQTGYNTSFAARLAQTEATAAIRLASSNGVGAVSAALPDLQRSVAELVRLQTQPVPLDEALVRRFGRLTNQVVYWAQAADQWNSLQSALPRSLEEHLDRLRQLAQSPFASAAEQNFVVELTNRNVSQTALLGELLLPGKPELWASLTGLTAATDFATPQGAFKPAEPSEPEKQAYLKLREDPNLQDVHAYQLTAHSHSNNPCRSHAIFTRGKLASDKLGRQAGLIYDPQRDPGTLRFEEHFIDDWDYVKVEEMPPIVESDAFQRLGLRDWIDPNTGNYQLSILELLDRLSQDRNSSPVFLAFLALRLAELAALRPADWGLQWSPTASTHLQILKDSGGAMVKSGDWMVPNQDALYRTRLGKYFEQTRAISFDGEAHFFHRLARQTCATGFAFAGFVDAKGVPKVNRTNAIRGEFWGWSSRTGLPALLLQKTAGTETWQTLDKPLPFTPLFVFLGDRRLLLEQSAKAAAYPLRGLGSTLPPLFSGLYE